MSRRSPTFSEELGSYRSGMGRWILPALILSLLIHAALWMWANRHTIAWSNPVPPAVEVHKTFRVEKVELDPKVFEPAPDPVKKTAAAPTAIRLPEERVALGKPMAAANAESSVPRIDAGALADKPSVEETSLAGTMQIAHAAGAKSLVPDDKTLTDALAADQPSVSTGSIVNIATPKGLGAGAITRAGAGAASTLPGFSNLDDLLAQTGPLSPETAPILMPTDLLFDYNASDLRPQALASLEKLGRLIGRNPGARFVIEGHTDSFGTDEYNNDLSLRRADSVKAFLTGSLGLPADRIETRGFGKSRLIAPATGSIDEQQINRRVEIVIRAPANP